MANENVTSIMDVPTIFANAANSVINSTIAILPNLIAAVVVFVLGWIVAVIAGKVVKKILELIKFENFLKMHKVEDTLGTVKISDVIAKIVKIYLVLVFLQVAASLVNLGQLSTYLYAVLLYVPIIIGALLLVIAAALIGEYVKEKILELGKTGYVAFLARGSKFVIVLVGILTGLNTAGFDTSLLNSILLTVVQALVFGLGLALGIAFGLGGQKDAGEIVSRIRKTVKV